MKKSTLENFIKKYSINGNINSVKFSIDSKQKQLKTSMISDEKNVLGSVVAKDFTDIQEDLEFGIYDTAKLKSMISVLDEDITLSVDKNNKGAVTALNVVDAKTTVQFVTADLQVIPNVPALKKTPNFNVEIELNSEFVTKFIKAKNSLSEEQLFTILMNKKNELVTIIGHSAINSNRITLNTKTLNGLNSVGKEISFNANYFKDILASNSDCENAVYKVSDAGLSTVTFVTTEFESTYYIVETKKA